MNDNTKRELKEILGITDSTVIDSVIQYAQSLNMAGRKANDYALAKALNERATSIVSIVASAYQHNTYEATSLDVQSLNKSYVLIVNELKKIYTRNKELTDISSSPAWKYLDIIEGAEWEINEYVFQNQNDAGYSHNAQVNKLCIIAGTEAPQYTPELKQIVEEADKAITVYRTDMDEQKRKSDTNDRNWYIPEYKVTYGLDGTILVNGVLKLKKVHAGSAPDRLMEQATKQPNAVFKPDLGKTARNLSTTLSSMGFTGTLRALFFPSVSKDKGILFRPTVKRATVDTEHLDTADLDLQLKELGATTNTKQISLDEIPF